MKQEQVKTIVAVGDGMADEAMDELGGKTPLEVAHTPHMDFLASNGTVGMLRTIPRGMDPGSDVANMALMGYSPRAYYTGRAPLEAASLNLSMGVNDLAFRCNLVTLEEKGERLFMGDHSGGGIPSDLARVWIEELNRSLAGPELSFHPGVAYRHLLLLKDVGSRFSCLETTPPHDIIGQQVQPFLPRGDGAEEIIRLLSEARKVVSALSKVPRGPITKCTANAIWLWGQGHAPRMPSLKERFGIRGATVCAVDLIKGLGRYAGLDSLEVPGATGDLDTDYQAKAVRALEAFGEYDLVFLHVEAPDEAGHQGNLVEKIRAIEKFDHEVIGTLRKGFSERQEEYRLLVLPDHPTPIRTRTHSKEPVPFVLYTYPLSLSTTLCFPPSAHSVTAYHEREAERTGIRIEEGYRLLETLLQRGCEGALH